MYCNLPLKFTNWKVCKKNLFEALLSRQISFDYFKMQTRRKSLQKLRPWDLAEIYWKKTYWMLMYWKTEGLGWKIDPHWLDECWSINKITAILNKKSSADIILLVGAPPENWVHPQIEQLCDEQSGCTPRKLGAPPNRTAKWVHPQKIGCTPKSNSCGMRKVGAPPENWVHPLEEVVTPNNKKKKKNNNNNHDKPKSSRLRPELSVQLDTKEVQRHFFHFLWWPFSRLHF